LTVSSRFLADYIANAEDGLEMLIPAAASGQLDGKNIPKLCDRFRQRGVCSFLLNGDPRAFFVNAMQSAGAYLYWIGKADDQQKVTSEARPFYDAAGCGFWECAEGIARASRTTHHRNKEYEEDFLFTLFLMKHFFLGAPEEECRSIIARHEAVTEGQDEAHRNVCIALLDRDSGLFDRSVRELLQERAARTEAAIERQVLPEELWSWLRYFSLEGFALLKLAERAGLAVGREYLHVSDSLREGPGFAFDPNAWRQLNRVSRPES
jgi:hypothetical protein